MQELKSLHELALALGFASAASIDEALARQLIYGGDFALNCLELRILSEAQLFDCLERSSPVPVQRRISTVDAALTEKLTETLGGRFVARREGLDYVITCAALPTDETLGELTREFGRPIRVELTLAHRLDDALYQLRAQALTARVGVVLRELGSHPIVLAPLEPEKDEASLDDVAPVALPPVEDEVHPWSEPMPVRRAQLEEQPTSVDDGVTAPPPVGYDAAELSAARDFPPLTSSSPERRQLKKHILAEVTRALGHARERDDVVELLLDGASEYFDFCAIFSVGGTEARCISARGPGAGELDLPNIRIPLDLPSAYKKSISSGVHQLARLRASGIEGGITLDLKRPSSRRVLLLPILIRGRTVLLLQGDRGDVDVDLLEVGDLLSVGPAVSQALERVVLERKRASLLPSPLDAGKALREQMAVVAAPGRNAEAPRDDISVKPPRVEPPAVAVEPPVVVEPPPVGVETPALEVQAPEPSRVRPPDTRAGVAPPQDPPPIEAGKRRVPTSRGLSDPPPSPEAPSSKEPHEAVPVATRPLSDAPPFAAEPSKTLPGYPGSARLPEGRGLPEAPPPPEALGSIALPPRAVPQTTSLTPRRIVPLESQSALRTTTPMITEAPGFVPRRGSDLEIRPTGTLVSRRPLLNEPPEDGWDSPSPPEVRAARRSNGPKSYGELVDQLISGDHHVLELLREGGESAVATLIARFPGPVQESSDPKVKASSLGPVLHALAEHGTRAVPFVTVRTADEDPTVRRYATMLLGELPCRESARAVADRLLDTSIEVRRAALNSARALQSDLLSRRTLRADLEELTVDKKQGAEARCAAIEAIADIREQEAIPTLLQLLSDSDRSVVRAAGWALTVLTRQDFGQDPQKWREFWQEHRDTPRVEWLILALGQNNADLRRAALDELSAFSGQSFVLGEEASENERRRVQAEVRAWLDARGQSGRRV